MLPFINQINMYKKSLFLMTLFLNDFYISKYMYVYGMYSASLKIKYKR